LIPTILIFDFGIILTVWYFSFFFVSCQYLHQVKQFKYCYLFHRKLYKKRVLQLLAHDWWFSPGTPASSTTKTGRHDIGEILLKVALKHQKSNQINQTYN